MDRIAEGKRVFDIEIKALEKTRDSLGESFLRILDMIVACKGKVIITGIGKSGHIAAKLAATLASLGTSSFFLHPAEAMHGDLGMVEEKDVVIAISYSGESDEVIRILPSIKIIGAYIIGITGNESSTLARFSDEVQVLPKFDEACYLGLAPTSSTTSVLCYGDALAVVLSAINGLKEIDFGKFHPAGALGKKLIYKVDELMDTGNDNAVIGIDAQLKDAIIEISKKGLGIVSVVDSNGCLKGVITDGDLRRVLERNVDVYQLSVNEVMSKKPISIQAGKAAVEALNQMKKEKVSCMPVLNGEKVVGLIRLQSIVGIGIVG